MAIGTRVAVTLAAALCTVPLAACGGSNDDGVVSSGAAHNQADVEFVQGMIPHHEQAVTMSELAASRAASPGVKALATRIQAAQAPEITQIGWPDRIMSSS